MKKFILLSLIGISSYTAHTQEPLKNSISTSLIRLERNSQTVHHNFNLKFVTGLEYQRHFNRWSVGIKYEHGYNKIKDIARYQSCYDCIYGTGYMKEDNVYLTSNYSAFNLFNNQLKFNIGLSVYYSQRNYSGDFWGGYSGGFWRKNSTYNTFGFAPNISIAYYPIDYLFISLDATYRIGWSKMLSFQSYQKSNVNEFVLTSPELKIGVRF